MSIHGTRRFVDGPADIRLRRRSPFSISVIVMVGARVRDGGAVVSDVQRQCRLHAQRIGEDRQDLADDSRGDIVQCRDTDRGSTIDE